MRIASVGTAFPEHVYSQRELTAAMVERWDLDGAERAELEEIHAHCRVQQRHLALPLAEFLRLESFTTANDAYIRSALELGERAVDDALARAGLERGDVDQLFFTSITGVAAPSIDARLMNRMGLRKDVVRTPIFGLGCVGGAAGIARAAQVLLALPRQVAVVLAVELCTLTVQWHDRSMANRVAAGLFGDGAAAVVLAGESRSDHSPRVIATRSVFYPESEHLMGWRIGGSGLGIVLSPDVPKIVEEHLGGDVRGFLGEHGLRLGDVATWICHPGGPKVLEAFERTFALGRGELALTWASLAAMGNLSSASVLTVLRATLEQKRPAPGSHGLLIAMGPGFCSELVLLRW